MRARLAVALAVTAVALAEGCTGACSSHFPSPIDAAYFTAWNSGGRAAGDCFATPPKGTDVACPSDADALAYHLACTPGDGVTALTFGSFDPATGLCMYTATGRRCDD